MPIAVENHRYMPVLDKATLSMADRAAQPGIGEGRRA